MARVLCTLHLWMGGRRVGARLLLLPQGPLCPGPRPGVTLWWVTHASPLRAHTLVGKGLRALEAQKEPR